MRALRVAPVGFTVSMLALIPGCSTPDSPTGSRPVTADLPAVEADPVVVAAGDIVCGSGTASTAPCEHAATAALVGSIAPSAVLVLGDNQYERGTLADFNAFYHPTWGAHKAITWPVVGNAEYATAGAAGYFDYFNGPGVDSARAGARTKGYYSFDLGAWHLIALNSNCAKVGGCGAGSPQEQWLRADLAANPRTCTLAYWHHPRFSSGEHGNASFMQAIWKALYDHRADLVLQGHDHDYERFAPQKANGTADPIRGMRSFVVGTGGKEQVGFSVIKANSEVRSSTAVGVLKLTLRASGYDWEFVPIPGDALTDAGSAACVASSSPPTQSTLTIPASADAYTQQSQPSTAFGTRARLLVDGSPLARTYLKFQVTGVTGKTVVSAKLRVNAVDTSDAGGRLHRVTDTSWDEAGLSWSSQPSYDSEVIGSIGSVAAGSVTANNWYEVDVKSQITGDGPVSFVLESSSTDGVFYRAREAGASVAPRLVIVLGQ